MVFILYNERFDGSTYGITRVLPLCMVRSMERRVYEFNVGPTRFPVESSLRRISYRGHRHRIHVIAKWNCTMT